MKISKSLSDGVLAVFLAVVFFNGCSDSAGRSRSSVLFDGSAADYFTDPDVLALCHKIERGDAAECSNLCDKAPDVVNAKGKQGVTPLFWAIQSDELPCFELLLDKGATATNGTERSFTVVHFAARHRNPKFLSALIYAGVNIDVGNGPRGRTPLGDAAVVGNLKALDMLICAGAELDSQDEIGNTAAYLAASQGEYESVHCLVKAGSNPLITNSMSRSLVSTFFEDGDDGLSHRSEAYGWYQKVRGELVRRGIL